MKNLLYIWHEGATRVSKIYPVNTTNAFIKCDGRAASSCYNMSVKCQTGWWSNTRSPQESPANGVQPSNSWMAVQQNRVVSWELFSFFLCLVLLWPSCSCWPLTYFNRFDGTQKLAQGQDLFNSKEWFKKMKIHRSQVSRHVMLTTPSDRQGHWVYSEVMGVKREKSVAFNRSVSS